MILAAGPSLCRWRIWVIAAMCVASFAAPVLARRLPEVLQSPGETLDRRVPPKAAKRSQVTDRDTPATSPITVAAVFWSFARRSHVCRAAGLWAFEQFVIKGDGGQPSGQPTPSDRQALTGTLVH